MEWITGYIARIIRAAGRAYERKRIFLGFFALVFLGNIAILIRLDLLPESSVNQPLAEAARASALAVPELPTQITVPTIGLSAVIANPAATNTAALDKALLSGAVRYPTSARLGEEGNVVLFGHSSYLPIVGNRAYKTFNGIQKLKAGDTIIVSSSGRAYTYRVKSVMKEDTSDGAIPLSVAGKVLTLSTCDSFSNTKTSRFVVVADFVESHPASS